VIYVLRDGVLVEKDSRELARNLASFPSPLISRMESYDSPVDGRSISSWRQRDADMNSVNAVDPRDIPRNTFEKRKATVERNARADDPD